MLASSWFRKTWQRCLHCQHVYCTNVEAQRRRSNVKPSKGCTSKGCTPLPSVEQAQRARALPSLSMFQWCATGVPNHRVMDQYWSIAQHIVPGSWSELTGKDMQEIPRQTSGNDCGVFMLMYSLWLCTDTTFHYSVLDMQSIRRWWCVLLMERFGIEGWRLVQGVPCLPPECS
ncbi:uncharacterized protein LOC133633920 isoform X4 [Entelurus aequoreus]|uniref:uncharacterized protein LOC133633920 isoform X4 n=1 Tax=Entelurus aequoreus TaxID=161455 RepID=UPI002B1E1F76|nr:uncharacterized protein LOC133633920 isoform X4 [Entelurus aequoreus]